MALRAKAIDLKLPQTFKEASKLTKVKLKQLCESQCIDFESNIGKKALVGILCNALIFLLATRRLQDVSLQAV